MEEANNGGTQYGQQVPEHHRSCHVIKRADFVGYGFHLHAEKGKPGQFIGKVDPFSPAESAGLRQGDRIVEVNGVPINQETHKEVVERIKALEQEVRLLVLDSSQDPTGTALAKKDTSAVSPTPAAVAAVAAVTNTTTTTNGHKSASPPTTLEPPKKTSQNGNGAMKIETAPKVDHHDLHDDLQLSVAEFRAKLANKKKVDPKRESVDIKKKYEMVQML